MSEKLHREVVMLGTSHSFQLGAAGDALAHELERVMDAACIKRKISAVAEEMSVEAIAEKGVDESLGMRLAAKLGLPHRLCDPGPALRRALGMIQESDLRAAAWANSLSKEETAEQVRAEYSRRERYWLDQLRELDVWPVLFICGANHVLSFSAMLREAGIAVVVEAHDWPIHDNEDI